VRKLVLKLAVDYASATSEGSYDAWLFTVTGWLVLLNLTVLQLYAGVLFSGLGNSNNIFSRTRSVASPRGQFGTGEAETLLEPHATVAVAHAVGSFMTNLGFFYGSATVVQLVKLLEPYVVLLLLRCLCAASKTDFLSLWGSLLTITVGAYFSVTGVSERAQKTDNLVSSIFASVGSALMISLRNVMKAKRNSERSTNGIERFNSAFIWSEMEDFRSFSSRGARILLIPAVLLNMLYLFAAPSKVRSVLFFELFDQSALWTIILHPCYNMFSLAALTRLPVVTHSLLGVFKRITSVLFAVYFAHEVTDHRFKRGIILSFLGGVWYSSKSFKVTEWIRRGYLVSERTTLVRKRLLHLTALSFGGLFLLVSRKASFKTNCKVLFRDPRMSLCHYVSMKKNFGDELGPAVVKHILRSHFGCDATGLSTLNLARSDHKTYRNRGRICLFTVGSVFHMVHSGDHVWGTGINPYRQKNKFPSTVQLYAVRGKLTESTLKQYNLLRKDVAHGDPGLFVSEMVQSMKGRRQHFCFVPHAKDEAFTRTVFNGTVISVMAHWEEFLLAVGSCSHIVSSSLHGLVVADSLGIPSRWFQYSEGTTTKITEGSFKYRDYFSIAGTLDSCSLAMNSTADVTNESAYCEPMTKEALNSVTSKLRKSFPLQLFTTDRPGIHRLVLGAPEVHT
jgi:hypothetical protein